jgi:hypothetical protein
VTSPYPMADISLGLRFLLAMTVQVFLPGWLLAGRRLTGWDGVTRFYAAMASGLILQSLLGSLLSFARIPLSGWLLSAAAVALASFLDRRPWWRRALDAIGGKIRPAHPGEALSVAVSAIALLAFIVHAFAGFSAPPHLHDASNHSFMALRILQTRSLDPSRLFVATSGQLPLPYLLGWHVTAATSCDLSGLAPYVACWYLSVIGAALLPLGLNLFWRAAGIGPAVAVVAAAVAVSNFWVPTGLYSWGGLGMILGLAVMPWFVIVARGAIRRPSLATGAAAAGAAIALLHIHSSEVFTAVLLLIVVWPRHEEQRPVRSDWLRAALAAGLVILAFGLLPALPLLRAYTGAIAAMAPGPRPPWPEVWRDYLHGVAGIVPLLRWLAPLGLLGIFIPALRRLAAAALAVSAVYFALRWLRDPLSAWLTQPYYRQWARLLYVMVFLFPPLVVAVLARPSAWLKTRVNRRVLMAANAAGAVALVVWGTVPGLRHAGQNLANQRIWVPFTASDFELAQQLEYLPPRDGVVANLEADGSFWAMHVSQRTFLDPCAWNLAVSGGRSWRTIVPQLARRPWPDEVKAMQEERVAFLLVSDHLLPGAEPVLRRADLEGDLRFDPVLTNDQTTLYRIRWDAEP